MRLQGAQAPRPSTHDLFATTIAELKASVTRVAISERVRPFSCSRPNAMFFSTVMWGNSAYDWNIMLTGRS